MSKREMTVEYLREMVKKSFANVDIDEGGKMCVLPFQSLVDTIQLYEDKLACQEAETERLTDTLNQYMSGELINAETMGKIISLEKQVDGLKLDLENWKKAAYGYKYSEEQAVKGTAKEILKELDLFFKGTTFRKGYEFKKIDEKLKEIAKRKGVEVE